MISGNLQIKKGLYYAVINYKNLENKSKQKWYKTGIKAIKGNKKRALEALEDFRNNFDETTGDLKKEEILDVVNKELIDIKETKQLFGDYLIEWLEEHKQNIELNTYFGYKVNITKIIAPYFNEKKIALVDLTDKDLKDFYKEKLNKVSANTVVHYHANIRKALEDAFMESKIISNPAAKVKKPKIDPFIGSYYNVNELETLFDKVKGTKIEFAVLMAAYYGLRRSEVLGLKWDAFDFYYNTITIKHTVLRVSNGAGERITIKKDRTKNKKSYRTLPLMPKIIEVLKKIKVQQDLNQESLGNYYDKSNLEYINVDDMGSLINPDYITDSFSETLKKHNLKKIRYHDLRHSCATLLRHEGVPIEDIQRWLGHSSVRTTESIYAHFEDAIHLKSADSITNAFAKQKIKKQDEMEM